MDLLFLAASHHILEVDDLDPIYGGQTFTIDDEERALELLTEPGLNVIQAHNNLNSLDREQLNEYATSLGVEDPGSLRNIPAVIKAIEEKQPEAAGVGQDDEPNTGG